MQVQFLSGVLYCNTCNLEKEAEEFPWRNKAKGIKQKRCKACMRIASRQHYHQNSSAYNARNERRRQEVTEYVRAYKVTRGCQDCGRRDLPYYALDFDHQYDKLDHVATMAQHSTLPRVKREIAKCEVVCATCHRLRHPPERFL